VLEEAVVDELLAEAGIVLQVDVAERTLTLPDGRAFQFPIDAFSRTCLLEGVDALGYLLLQDAAIDAFEQRHSILDKEAAHAR
jgi:3-isopropylmalate/(R)-2-methylmalate dehydratase small subunit